MAELNKTGRQKAKEGIRLWTDQIALKLGLKRSNAIRFSDVAEENLKKLMAPVDHGMRQAKRMNFKELENYARRIRYQMKNHYLKFKRDTKKVTNDGRKFNDALSECQSNMKGLAETYVNTVLEDINGMVDIYNAAYIFDTILKTGKQPTSLKPFTLETGLRREEHIPKLPPKYNNVT